MTFLKKMFFAAAAVCSFGIGSAHAATFAFEGMLQNPDGTQLFSFDVVDAPTTLALRTFQYGGGSSGGVTSAGGGFDPILTLFDFEGTEIARNDDEDVGNGFLDSFISFDITSNGSYTLALQVSPKAAGTSFYSGLVVCDGQFDSCGSYAQQVTSSWAVEISDSDGDLRNVQEVSAVPLPAGLPLLLVGLGAFGLMRRRAAA